MGSFFSGVNTLLNIKTVATDIESMINVKSPYFFNILFLNVLAKIIQGIKKILNLLFKIKICLQNFL